MIKSIKIQNIQSYKEASLSFSKGVNTIIGKSDSGKSGILNCIRWPRFNRPLGDIHRNWGGGKMLSKVVFDNGSVSIIRDKQTEYKVKLPNQKTKTFKASGQNPPDEVIDLFNMDQKINFQKQLEKNAPIFLLSESPGEVATFFNKIGGFSKIKETEKRGQSDVRKTNSNLENTKQQIKEKQKEIAKYDGIDDLYAKVCLGNQIVQKTNENERKINNLGNILYQINKLETKNQKLQQKLKIKDLIQDAFQFHKIIKRKKEFVDSLEYHLQRINKIEQKQIELNSRLGIDPKIQKAQKVFEEIDDLTDKCNDIWNIRDKISMIEQKQDELKEKQEKQENEFHELMPEQCPLCGK
jgi:DNA repair exonuclease SbcCD ATPase subunit